MRTPGYFPLIVCSLVWAAACSPATPLPPTSPAVVVSPATRGPHVGPTPTVIATVSQPPAQSGPTVQVDVTVTDDKLSSSMTTFHVGTAYLFVVKNTGTHELCFDIAPPEHATGSLAASLAAALVDIPQNKLPTGAVVQAPYTFNDSAAGVPLELSCLVRRAYDDNVRLAITVTK